MSTVRQEARAGRVKRRSARRGKGAVRVQHVEDEHNARVRRRRSRRAAVPHLDQPYRSIVSAGGDPHASMGLELAEKEGRAREYP